MKVVTLMHEDLDGDRVHSRGSVEDTCPICNNPRSDGNGSLTQWIIMCKCQGPAVPASLQGQSVGICYQCGKSTRQGSSGSISQFIFQRDFCSCGSPEGVSALLNGPSLADFEAVLSRDEQELEVSPYLFPVARFKPLSLLEIDSDGASYLARDRVLDSVVIVSVAHTLEEEYSRAFFERAKELCKTEDESSSPKLLNAGLTIAAIPYIVTQVTLDDQPDDEARDEDQEAEQDYSSQGQDSKNVSHMQKTPIIDSIATPTTPANSRYGGVSKLATFLAFAFGISAAVSLVWLWAQSVLREPTVDHISAPVKKVNPEENLADSLTMYEASKWTRMTLNGGTVYDAGPVNTDEDFAELLRYNGVESLRVIRSDTITGTGLRRISSIPLTAIQLDSTQLSDDGLRAMAAISTLRGVGFGWGAKVTDTGFRELTKLKNIEMLSLDYFKFPENSMTVIASLQTLTALRIAVPENLNRGEISRLAALNRLRSVVLSAAGITDDDCFSLSKLSHVEELELMNNEITDRGVEQLAKMPLLKLNLSGNDITDRCLLILGKITTLKELTINDCPRVTERAKIAFLKARPRCWLSQGW